MSSRSSRGFRSLLLALIALTAISPLAAADIHAEATPEPVLGTSTTVTLTGDTTPNPGVTYQWRVTATPVGGHATIANPTQKTTTVTFSAAGRYRLECDRTDPTPHDDDDENDDEDEDDDDDDHAKTKTYKIKITVKAVLTQIHVVPATVDVAAGAQQVFTARGTDQFGASFGTLGTVTWSVSGSGTITTNGTFTAGATSGTAIVTADVGGVSSTATVTVLGVNPEPTISAPATATPSVVTGTTTDLSVLGADNGGEPALTYTWSSSGPAPVSVAPNGSNAARLATATFTGAGFYTLTATITDAQGASVTSSVGVDVSQTATTLAVVPATATTIRQGSRQFETVVGDQFAHEIVMPPTTWSLTGVGSVSTTGLFTAGSNLGSASIIAQVANLTATATATVVNGVPSVATLPTATPNPVTSTSATLSILGADDFGEASLIYTWTGPVGVTFSENGSSAAKNATATFSASGSYPITCTIQDVDGLTVSSAVTVSVQQTPTTVQVTPATASVMPGATQEFAATVADQFALAIATPTVAWSVSGGGTISTSGVFTALSSGGTGTYTVTATTAGISGTATVTVEKATPTLTWAAPLPIVYGTALSATQLAAQASVPGTFVYAPASGTVLVAGNQVLSVTFTPTDPDHYTSATATVPLTVEQAAPTLTWATPAPITYGTALDALQLSATADIPGTFVYTPTAGTILAAGPQTLSVVFTPADAANYLTATASVSLTVLKATPVLTWAEPAPVTYGTALGSEQLAATTTVAGTTLYTPAAGTVLPAGQHTVQAAFTPTDTDNYTTASASVTLTVQQATPLIAWTAPASIDLGTPLSATQLNATASIAGTLVYTPPSGTVLAAGTQSLSVTVTPSDLANYTIATATVTIQVIDHAPVITGGPTATLASAGTSASCVVTASDDGGEANLTYMWTATGPASVTVEPNGTNAAKNATATFSASGAYTFVCSVMDGSGSSIAAELIVTVSAVPSLITVSPATATVSIGGSSTFTAVVADQFGTPLDPQPTITWTATGAGTIDATGLFQAGGTSGSATVTATAGSVSGQTLVTVSNAPVIITAADATPQPVTGTTTTLSVLGADNGGEENLIYTWVSTGPVGVAISPNGTNGAKNATATFGASGDYTLTVTITDAEAFAVTSSTLLTVVQTPTVITVTPNQATISVDEVLTLYPKVMGQFGAVIGTPVTWSVTGGGTITSDGTFTASTSGTSTITAVSGAISAVATVLVDAPSVVRVPSLLVRPAPFDATAWATNADYRTNYLAAADPGQVWQQATPSSGAAALTTTMATWCPCAALATVPLMVQAIPGAPVTFVYVGEGSFADNGRNVICIVADASGVAQVTARAPTGGTSPILVSSPLCSGQIRFALRVAP